jgi:hypothetical protein
MKMADLTRFRGIVWDSQKDASASASSDNHVLAERPTLHLEVFHLADVMRDQLKTEGKAFSNELVKFGIDENECQFW